MNISFWLFFFSKKVTISILITVNLCKSILSTPFSSLFGDTKQRCQLRMRRESKCQALHLSLLDLISLSIGIALIEKKCSECTKTYQSGFQILLFYVVALVAYIHACNNKECPNRHVSKCFVVFHRIIHARSHVNIDTA